MAINATSLTDYVKQSNDLLLANTILGAKTLDYMTIQTGVKTSEAIHQLNTETELQDGKSCGWTEAGSSKLTDRVIKTGMIKVNQSFCELDLLGKWAEYDVRFAAGQETLPFQEKFIEGVVRDVNKRVDKVIWQGDTASVGADEDLKRFDGLIKILNAADPVKLELDKKKTKMEQVSEIVAAIPEEGLEGARVFCSLAYLRGYTAEMVRANLYHYTPDPSLREVLIPGTDIYLTAVPGLKGLEQPVLVVGQKDNLYFGCDLSNGREVFKFWYSDDNDEFRLKIRFNAGVQAAFPNRCVVATLSLA